MARSADAEVVRHCYERVKTAIMRNVWVVSQPVFMFTDANEDPGRHRRPGTGAMLSPILAKGNRMSTRSRALTRRVMTLAVAAALIAVPVGAAHAQTPTTASATLRAADSTPAPTGSASATTLRIATSGYVDSFNPFTSIYLLPTNLIRYMYESLVQNDQQDGSPTKGLADSWTTENDGKTWIFTLQDGLTWSDGEPITAADVVYTYDQMMTVPELSVANGNLVTNFEKVTARDDKTVVIDLKAPQAPNPGSEIPIVPQHVWEKISDPATYANDSDIVGSGSFLLDSYSANQSITLKANPDFWRGAPKIDRIQYIYYTNSDAQVQALRAGEVDFVTGLTATQFDALQGADGITTHSGEGRRYTSYSLNAGMKTRDGQPFGTGNPALAELEVRQAIRQGVDTKALLKNVLQDQGVLGTSFIPASFAKWSLPADDPAIMPYDPDAAKKLLDDAGWTAGADGIRQKDGKTLSLRLLVDAEDVTEQSIAEYFVPWMKEIGIDIKVESTDGDTISTRAITGDYDIYLTGWSVNPDPDYQLGINLCSSLPSGTDGTGGTTQDGYCDPAFDALYAQQRSELDESKREQIVHDMLAMNYTATAQIVFWYGNSLEAYRSDRFTNFSLQPEKNGIIANQAGYWGYLTVEPVGAASDGGGGVNVGLIIVAVVVALLIIVAIVIAMARRRKAGDRE